MVDLPQMKELAVRKRLLLATIGVQRHVIAANYQHLARKSAWLERGYSVARAALPLWKVAAPVAAWLIVKKGRSVGSWVGKAVVGLKLAKSFTGVWRSMKSSPPTGPASPGL